MEFHVHNGQDMDKIQYSDLQRKLVYIPYRILSANTATSYGVVFTANENGRVVYISESHKTAGSSGGAVTMDLEKLTGTTASGSGRGLLRTKFNLKNTANTVVQKENNSDFVATSISNTIDITFKKGERLGMTTIGTLTAVDDVVGLLIVMYD